MDGVAFARGTNYYGGTGFLFNDNIQSSGSVISNGQYLIREDGRNFYGVSPNALYICTGINKNGSALAGYTLTSVWRQFTFKGGLLVGISSPSDGTSWYSVE